MKRNLVIALLSLFASQGVFALDCTDNAVSAIVNLAEQINPYYSSHQQSILSRPLRESPSLAQRHA